MSRPYEEFLEEARTTKRNISWLLWEALGCPTGIFLLWRAEAWQGWEMHGRPGLEPQYVETTLARMGERPGSQFLRTSAEGYDASTRWIYDTYFNQSPMKAVSSYGPGGTIHG